MSKVNESRIVEIIYCDWCEKEITDLGYCVFKGKLFHFHDDCYEQFFDNDKKLLKDES